MPNNDYRKWWNGKKCSLHEKKGVALAEIKMLRNKPSSL